MIEADWCRKHVNQSAGALVRAFKWAAAEELVGALVWHALRCVEGLKAGRTTARESRSACSAELADVEAAKAHLPAALRAAVDLQLLTGAARGSSGDPAGGRGPKRACLVLHAGRAQDAAQRQGAGHLPRPQGRRPCLLPGCCATPRRIAFPPPRCARLGSGETCRARV